MSNRKPQFRQIDHLIRELWLAYRDLSAVYPAEEWSDADLLLWERLTAHPVIQSRLDQHKEN